jgi:hypothetical protein
MSNQLRACDGSKKGRNRRRYFRRQLRYLCRREGCDYNKDMLAGLIDNSTGEKT